MVLCPPLSPEEINLITVKEQRISDKLKKKKAQPWENIYCKCNLPCNAGESEARGSRLRDQNKEGSVYTLLRQQPHVFLAPCDL